MRRAAGLALFALGLLLLSGSLASMGVAAQADEGLADLGYAILAAVLFVLSGGAFGGHLLTTPRGETRWRVAVSATMAALSVLAALLLTLQGLGTPAGARAVVIVVVAALPAVAGLVRVPRVWRG